MAAITLPRKTSKVKIFIDICNSAKTMLLGKGLTLAVGAWAWFHFNNKVECPSRVFRDSSS